MKFKIKVLNEQLIIKRKISSEDKVSKRELDILNRQKIKGLFKIELKKKYIEYMAPQGTALYEFLKEPISKYDFFSVMIQLIDIIKKLQKNNLFLNNLILDLRWIYINRKTKDLNFIYEPFITNHVVVNIAQFIEAIAYSARPIQGLDYSFINRYISFIKSMSILDYDMIREYISNEDKELAALVRKRTFGESGFITDKPQNYYEHYRETGRDSDFENAGTVLLNESIDSGTAILDSYIEQETGLLGDDEGTMLLEDDSIETAKSGNSFNQFPFLTRLSTGEVTSIDKPVFRIGKEKSYVDFFISSNQAVSRSHADIISRGMKYYVCDLNSTNHTYINDRILEPKVEAEIMDGDILRLANEEFVFNIE